MKKFFLSIIIAIFSLSNSYAGDDHDHKKEDPKHEEHGEQEDHKEHGDHKKGDEHEDGEHAEGEKGHAHGGHEEEENPQVGPNKGILAADEKLGFKLGVEAEKNFEISRLKVVQGVVELPKKAIVTAGTEVNVYRFREGFYKRIDFDTVSKNSEKITIRSEDLKAGDEVVINGMGFIRIAELAAFGGAPEGHSH